MRDYIILTDTAADLTLEQYKEAGVEIIPYYISFDGEKYYRDLYELSTEDFFKTLVEEKPHARTSLPNVQDFCDLYEKHASQGLDIFQVMMTAKFSGAYQCALTAKDIIMEKYPGCRIEVCDSRLCTGGQGLLLRNALKMKKSGAGLEELAKRMDQIKLTALITFSVDSLDHLVRGGRIGKVSGFMGGLLNIKPIIQMLDGELIPHSKVRGRKKALAGVRQIHMSAIDRPAEYEYVIINSLAEEEAAVFEKELAAEYGVKADYPLVNIGSTIGVHIGPNVVGLCSIEKYNARK